MNHRQVRDAVGCVPEDAATVGGVLRERRLARGLTVEEVAGAIRFGARHVLAVEQGRFDALPPPPYGRGLISAYADMVGVEPEALLRSCPRALSATKNGRKGRIFRLPIRERLTWRDWTIPFSLAIAFAGIVVVRAVLAPEPEDLEAPAASPGAAATAEAGAPAEQPVRHAGTESGPAPEPASGSDQEPWQDLQQEQEPQREKQQEQQSDTGPQPAPVAVAGVRVVLRCEGTTWAEAAADGGEMRRYELGPGQVLELVARERLYLSLGDAGVVRVRVGERELGFVGDKGETRTGMSFAAQKPRAAEARAPAGD